MSFTKMHGLGNDFIVIDCRETALSSQLSAVSKLSRKLCDRRLGIGADQILLLHDSDRADFRMSIFNADGSEVEMCGNGIRCFAKYIWDRKLSGKKVLDIETPAGIIRPEKSGDMVKVDMGVPILEARQIPVRLDGVIREFPLKILDKRFKITCVSMGNPHAVIFVDDVAGFDVAKYGPVIENHGLFPKRINVEFIQVLSPGIVRMRVWERGSGETLACGTGASAAAVASNLCGRTRKRVKVRLPGGDLMIDLHKNGHVYMTGPAVEVFEGCINI
ncbi:MAG: diaminopimelate epimerase [Nitrospirota bacterium]|nr:diaminopimelate epimerase [Nitrospirota bacterium]